MIIIFYFKTNKHAILLKAGKENKILRLVGIGSLILTSPFTIEMAFSESSLASSADFNLI
jgi:hypothetical protein